MLHLAAEAEQLGGPAAGGGLEPAGALDEGAALDEPAEVLLVEADAGQGLDRPLQLQQGEGLRQQLEHQGPVPELAAEAPQRGGEDAPVVEGQRRPERRAGRGVPGPSRPAAPCPRPAGVSAGGPSCPVAARLGDQPRLVEQFVAVEHPLGVPPRGPRPEGDVDAAPALAAAGAGRGRRRPGVEGGPDAVAQQRRLAAPVVLPRQEAVRRLPRGGMPGRDVALAHEGEVGHRDHPDGAVRPPVAVAVAERVQLFDVREVHAGLLAHPGAQTEFEGAVAVGVEGAERQGRGAGARHRQHPGLGVGDGDDGGVQSDRDAAS